MKAFTAARIGLAGALAVTVLVPGPADAAKVTHKLTGQMVDEATGAVDANSKVTVKVVVRNGAPKRLKALRFENVNGYCRDLPESPLYFTGELSGSGGTNLNPRIEIGNLFNWFSYPEDPPRRVEFFGRIKNRGKRINATLRVYNNAPDQCNFATGTVRLRN